MDCSTALRRKTKLESRRNCSSTAFGRKVMRLYLAVSTLLL